MSQHIYIYITSTQLPYDCKVCIMRKGENYIFIKENRKSRQHIYLLTFPIEDLEHIIIFK